MLSVVKEGCRMDYQSQPPGYVLTGERTHYVLAVDKRAWDDPDLEAVRKALKLPPRRDTYELDATTSSDSNGLRLTTRSVLGAMLYLSNAVSVPEVHNGLVDRNVDLNSPSRKLLEVRVSASPVDNTYDAVQHRGYWFYVGDEDIESKRTLGLLTSLVRLSISAGGAQNVPILTLPVSR